MDITIYRQGIEYVAITKEIDFIRGFCGSASNDKDSILDSLRKRREQIEGNPKTLVNKLTFLGGVFIGTFRPLRETRRFIQLLSGDRYKFSVRPQYIEQKRPNLDGIYNPN